MPVSPNEGVLDVGVGVKVKDPGLDWPGLAVLVLVGVGVGVLRGVFRYGLGDTVIGDGLGTAVAAEVAAGVSVGVAGRGMNGVGTSLAWLAGPGEAYAEGLVTGLLGAGAGAEGQRLQVAAQ